MKTKAVSAIAVALLTTTAVVHAAGNDTIPPQFQGVWGDKEACSSHKEYNTGLEVKSTYVGEYETGCKLKSVSNFSATTMNGTFKCSSDGTPSVEKISLTLLNGKLSYNGGSALSRCK